MATVGQPRRRTVVRGEHARRRLPRRIQEYRAWLEACRWVLPNAYRGPLIDGPFALTVWYPTRAGDGKNVLGAVEDAAQGILYRNDRRNADGRFIWGEPFRMEMRLWTA